jgi:hypothetical protein
MIEYERFLKYLNRFLYSKDIVEVYPEEGSKFYDEKHYQCTQCKQKWILGIPDFPFKGFWRRK